MGKSTINGHFHYQRVRHCHNKTNIVWGYQSPSYWDQMWFVDFFERACWRRLRSNAQLIFRNVWFIQQEEYIVGQPHRLKYVDIGWYDVTSHIMKLMFAGVDLDFTILYRTLPPAHHGCFNTKLWSSMTWMITGGYLHDLRNPHFSISVYVVYHCPSTKVGDNKHGFMLNIIKPSCRLPLDPAPTSYKFISFTHQTTSKSTCSILNQSNQNHLRQLIFCLGHTKYKPWTISNAAWGI